MVIDYFAVTERDMYWKGVGNKQPKAAHAYTNVTRRS